MTKLHTAAFEISDNLRVNVDEVADTGADIVETRLPLLRSLSADEVANIGVDIMETRLPLLRRLSVNNLFWEVSDVLLSRTFF
jgi:hypothetical protein